MVNKRSHSLHILQQIYKLFVACNTFVAKFASIIPAMHYHTHGNQLQGVEDHQRQKDHAYSGYAREKDFGHDGTVDERFFGAAKQSGGCIGPVKMERFGNERRDAVGHKK